MRGNPQKQPAFHTKGIHEGKRRTTKDNEGNMKRIHEGQRRTTKDNEGNTKRYNREANEVRRKPKKHDGDPRYLRSGKSEAEMV